MKVVHGTKNDRLAWLDTLLHVRPLPGKLEAGFNSLCTGIHRQYHVIPKHLGDSLCEAAEDRVIERTRRECQLLSLLYECGHYLWVAMSLFSPCQIEPGSTKGSHT